MEFNIGEKLKSLRKKREITQEQLAEHLNVSPQAISKWETNSAFPDIQLFPILANYYGVSTDEILGVDVSKQQDTINKYFNEMEVLYYQWKLKEMVDLCRKACSEFPGNLDLKYHLAWCLGEAQNVIRTKNENLNEAITICNKILEDSVDTGIRLRTLSRLCYCYHYLGDDIGALEYAKKLPSLSITKTFLISRLGLLKGREKLDYSRTIINRYLDAILEILDQIADVRYSDNSNDLPVMDRIEILKSKINILVVFYGENLLGQSWKVYECYRDIAYFYMQLNDKENSIQYLEKAYDTAILHRDYSDEDCYEIPIFRGIKTLPHHHWSQSAVADMNHEIFESEHASIYELLSNEPRYKYLKNQLKDNIIKHN